MNYVYKRQQIFARDIEESREADIVFFKSISDDLNAIYEERAAVVGKDAAMKEMQEALNHYSAEMAIQRSPW